MGVLTAAGGRDGVAPVAVALATCALAACGGPQFGDGDFRCGDPPDECPPGFTCAADGFCRTSAGDPDAAAAPDVRVIDSGPADANLCGNGATDTGEECDDNNLTDGDGCDSNCTMTACGNGIPTAGEVCYLAPVVLQMGIDVSSVALADMNNDGLADVVATDRSRGFVVTRLNADTGAFTVLLEQPAGPGAMALAVGYVDADGFLDVVTANHIDDSLSVLAGNGTGVLAPIQEPLLTPGAAPSAVVLVDLNADNKPELLALESGTGAIHPFTNDVGPFAPGAAFSAPPGSLAMIVADLDGMNEFDLAVTDPVNSQVAVYFGDGAGSFGVPAYHPADIYAVGVAALDVEPDGDQDLFVANVAVGSISWLDNDGSGSFLSVGDFIGPTGSIALAAVDVDNDARTDLAVAGTDGDLRFHRNVMGSGFVADATFEIPTEAAGIAAGNLNDDGVPDIAVAAGTTGGTVTLILSDP